MDTQLVLDTIWVLLTAMLVFFMNLGFALVESGFARSKTPSIFCQRTLLFLQLPPLVFFWLAGA